MKSSPNSLPKKVKKAGSERLKLRYYSVLENMASWRIWNKYESSGRKRSCRGLRGGGGKIPEGFELADMVSNDAKVVAKLAANLCANLVAKNDVNLALPPSFRQVLIESPL
ncbi:hypothetical protein TNCV_4249761 [Trichonephila clavipes]|nr:hypothetical protein TNCV_4249761 [Trichonephila clavipes]